MWAAHEAWLSAQRRRLPQHMGLQLRDYGEECRWYTAEHQYCLEDKVDGDTKSSVNKVAGGVEGCSLLGWASTSADTRLTMSVCPRAKSSEERRVGAPLQDDWH